MTVQRATILLCSLAFAVLAGSAAARPSRHQPVPAAQTDAADSDIRYPAAAAAATPTVATEERGSRHSRRRMTAYQAAQSHANSADAGFTGNSLVEQARQYIGTNPTGRSSLWCGAFMDMVLKQTGHAGGGNLAWGYSRYGTRVDGPQVGAIAVMHGHVGVVSGVDANGNPIIVSGNHNHTVAEAVYPRGRISAYVMP
jgi:uncharacterized protein (TIGR02594 family)